MEVCWQGIPKHVALVCQEYRNSIPVVYSKSAQIVILNVHKEYPSSAQGVSKQYLCSVQGMPKQ